ncbi:hypothetical protein C5167_038182 [Papaver somniferum]|uniref:Kinesin motor domain-containing protein n=1 Tax=Papaver somniferum TaxID=3469 RepID=A0A4Y7I8T2_PAPSO|nr:hypothetical protein C5167_038182 [Papaver somniferum]
MESTECVRVAVNVRPLINTEVLLGCTDCVSFIPGEPQVQIGTHSFTFDYVYGNKASTSSSIYGDCVAPLVDALFHGYNATVLAYGQTGSGKTYTMGTNYTGDGSTGGIIPQVMNSIFSKIEEKKEATEFLIRVSFIEIFKEEVFDLLDPNSSISSKGEATVAKLAAPARNPIQIRETANGGITLAGVTEPEVRTKQEMASFLSRGSLARATGSTNMNSQSSRSHAIFTISMEQRRSTCIPGDEVGDDILSAKLHLVDLAGSERAKRTGADGSRLKEGIHINRGLLALGNVISALGDDKKRKEGGHDSLGGNSKTVMIACVSPADSNAEETLNTLKYANRARNIQNKAIINRDPMTAQMQMMRSQLEQLQAELFFFRGEGGTTYDELQILRQKISVLEASNAELHRELHERQVAWKHLEQRAVDAQVEKDKLIIQIESSKKGKSWAEIDGSSDVKKDNDLLSTYVSKNLSLEAELMRLQSLNDSRGDLDVCLDLEDDASRSRNLFLPKVRVFPSDSDDKEVASVEAEQVEKEMEHSSLQDQLDKELQELDKRLEEKEAEMKQFGGAHTSVLRQHYEKKIQDLEHEKKSLEKEIEDIRTKHANISESKMKEEYHQKLSLLESQVAVLKKKQDAQYQLLKQKQKSDEAAKRLQDEIHRIKTQKVQLQQKIKQESEQFRLWKASREKEVLQLKKEGRRNEYEMHKLLALNQRQKMVLQRKTEEATMATKRLKELLEARKNSSRPGNGNGSVKALMNALEHELEVMVRVHEVRSEYERQKEARVAMANELAKLKEESEILRQKKISDSPQIMSPGARNSRIFALENMLATTSGSLVGMASQLSEAEERERVYAGKGRWAQVRTIADAKEVMTHLFSLASSSRCDLRDKEDECKEKDSLSKDLKEKVVKLNNLVRQLETKNEELIQREKSQRLANPRGSTATDMDIGLGHIYDLRKGPRSSNIFNQGGYSNTGLFDDMDTSDSKSDCDSETLDVEWGQSGKLPKKKKVSKKGSSLGVVSNPVDLTTSVGLFPNSTVEDSEVRSICCSCSKSSRCKTNKCQCRDAGGACGASCGCVPSKCENRESNKMRVDLHDSAHSDEIEEGEQNRSLAVHGAMLLQSALADKPPIDAKNVKRENGRKPLSDIGNTVGKTNASKQMQRKKWQKKIVQLVPVTPSSAQQDSIEDTAKPENTVEQEIPSKLPRAMRSTTANTDPFKEKNSEQAEKSFQNREVGLSTPRNTAWQTRDSKEKENHGI